MHTLLRCDALARRLRAFTSKAWRKNLLQNLLIVLRSYSHSFSLSRSLHLLRAHFRALERAIFRYNANASLHTLGLILKNFPTVKRAVQRFATDCPSVLRGWTSGRWTRCSTFRIVCIMNERQGPRAIWRECKSRVFLCARDGEMMMGQGGRKREMGKRERGGRKREIREDEHAAADWTMTAKSMGFLGPFYIESQRSA